MDGDRDRERDNRSGRYTTEFDLEDFVEAVKKLGFASTREVADEIGCSYDLAYRRLKELRDDGVIDGRKIGNTYHWHPAE